jgi:outer membrane protein assembly factor BamA
MTKVMKKLTWLYKAFCLIITLQLALSFLSCNSTKKLHEGEFLLDKNIIADKSSKVDKSEMEPYLKQKPNRKMLFWMSYLYLYNSVNQEKIEKNKPRRNARIESINSARIERNNRINKKREAKGKKPVKVFLKKQNTLTRREWILSIGEPPVIYDSLLAKKSARQINLFLYNKGFFKSVVKDSVSLKHKKAKVYYTVNAGKPYRFRKVNYQIKDNQLSYYVMRNESSTFIKQGKNYDVELLQKERDRITNNLRNDGYFMFSKEYIYFEVDSSLGSHEVDITLGIKNPVVKIEGAKDSTVETAHTRFYINNIYIHTDYDPKLKNPPKDTLLVNDYHLMSTGGLRYRPRLITDAVFFSKGELFQQSHSDQTYKRLSDLKLFRSTQIQFIQVGNSQLDCYIYLSNIPKQSFSAETEGTNTSGTLGIAGSLIYQNKNTFKGGEIFEVKLKGALEVQKTKTKEENLIITGIESPIPFNTLELGTEANLSIPRFVTPFNIKGIKNNNAKTNISGTFNFQRRPDFGRSIANISFGYSWMETDTKKHIINPIEFNLVNIFGLSNDLESTILNSKDLFLKNSYSNHFTLGTRYAFIFNNQNIRKKKSYSYLRLGAEGAGNAMRGAFALIDHNHPLDFYSDTTINPDGSINVEKNYTIENIRFSQYIRGDIDFRYYKILNDKDRLVYRISGGVGKPLYNLRVLPLEKSFFAGGPNSVRAWQARELGPGGFADSTNSNFADKIGDVKIESNLEYRFNVIKIVNAALFVDAGNIWLRKKYPSYLNGEFTSSKFIGQIAMGAGLGIRLDFNFFIIRLDGAFKLKDPSLPANDRWTFGRQPLNHGVLNFGIGYPF